jgi:formylglycine-generating enzyme required for sulfatase activity
MPIAPPTETVVGDTWTRPADGMVMIHVPAGEFEMGGTGISSDEEPVHTVVLDGFWIDRTEVSNGQYQLCAEAGACQASTTCGWGGSTYGDASKTDHPIACVNWHGAQAYCEWAGARLPTEAEWEYAARGPEGRIYPWGDDFECSRGNFDDETQLDNYVVPGGEGCDGYLRTAPVGSFPAGASWCGALDMAGNVWEWVADWYDSGYYARSPLENPTGPEAGDYRVLRGGGWLCNESNVRAANRYYSYPPDLGYVYIGFRCCVASRQD